MTGEGYCAFLAISSSAFQVPRGQTRRYALACDPQAAWL